MLRQQIARVQSASWSGRSYHNMATRTLLLLLIALAYVQAEKAAPSLGEGDYQALGYHKFVESRQKSHLPNHHGLIII